jgi:hypothetical protein
MTTKITVPAENQLTLFIRSFTQSGWLPPPQLTDSELPLSMRRAGLFTLQRY